MKKLSKTFLALIPNIILTIFSGVSLTLAWHVSIYFQGNTPVNPGQLNTTFNLASYNTTSATWVTHDPATPLDLDLGEMTNIAQLPPNTERYLKMKSVQNSNAITLYNIIVKEIKIIVSNVNGDYQLPQVNYYMTTPNQSVFDFYLVNSTINNADPTILFANYQSMTPFHVTALNYPLNPSNISLNTWTYVMLRPRLAIIQNIIRQIPVEYSPYTLVFDMNLSGEVVTVDEN